MNRFFISLYEAAVYKRAALTLIIAVALIVFLSQYAGNFRLDASSDTLTLENDQSLKYFNDVVSKYSTADFLVLTYSPKTEDLFSPAILDDMDALLGKLQTLELASSVLSILNVPLTQSPPLTLAEMSGEQQFLRNPKTDLALAKLELRDSQLYRDLLVSQDYSTTAFVISLANNAEVSALFEQRNALREKRAAQGLSRQERQSLADISRQYQHQAAAFQTQHDQLIEEVRSIIAEHESKAVIFLGGLPMIVTDSLQFIENDVVVFGSAAIVMIILILTIAFRQPGWVMIPLMICAITGLLMVSLLGLLNWPISVVSSNFLSLLLIITLSLNIHLIVRYRELAGMQPGASLLELIKQTISSKFIACVYTSLTTIVAFASLIVSGIRPVADFGYIMCLGIVVSLLTTFVLFPTLAVILKPKKGKSAQDALSKTVLSVADRLQQHRTFAVLVFAVLALLAGLGLSRLTVENRFIDYFKPDTEIYQGMHAIDAKLGGTTPLDIILDAPAAFFENSDSAIEETATQQSSDPDFDDFEDEISSSAEEDDFFDEFDDPEPATESAPTSNLAFSSYWFNEAGINTLRDIHSALEAMPETGKVLSLSSSMSIFENLKDAQPMDNIDLGFMYNVLPQEIKDILFTPYMSADGNQLHINIRVFESHKGLNRNQLIDNIRTSLIRDHGLQDEQININGMLVLYNNMLNSLFRSQIATLGTVFFVIMLMFIVLYRNVRLSLITIIPNVFSAGVVLGVMGLFSIPLDLMTITIAAITVGIAVDNSIHYVTRFRDEYFQHKNYATAIDTTTQNVGQAMFYTTLVISAGFLIMVFSNFVPTLYFGVLTALAMGTALLANLIMLPILLEKFKPYRD